MKTNILVLSIFLLVFSGAIILLKKNVLPRLNRLITWKSNFIFASVYLGLLLLFIPIAIFLIKEESYQLTNDNRNLVVKAPNDWVASPDIYRIPTEDILESLSEMHKNSSQTFKVNTNRLTVVGSTSAEYSRILIERKDYDDGEIEVSTYISPQYAGEYDFTQLVLPPTILLEKGIMTIESQNQKNLEFKRFDREFTINQFKQKHPRINSVHFGSKAVYLRIPKSMEIVNNGTIQVKMVN